MIDNGIALKLLINRIPAQKRKVIFGLFASAIFVLTIALLSGGIVYGGRSFLPISRIDVTEIPNMERADILTRAGIKNQTYWTLHEAQVKTNLLAIAAIKDVEVGKYFPDRLVIKIEARKPVAMIISRTGNTGLLQYIDETGRVFEKGRSASNMYLPLITDPAMQTPYAGYQCIPSVTALMRRMSSLSPDLLSHISEIEIDWKIAGSYKFDLYDLIVYIRLSSIKVRMRAELDDAYISRMLLAVKTVEEDPRYLTNEIDYRSNDPVFIPQGGGFR
ncbi:MAG: FtsQ-type POTRA domain-containing protein [Treponema sp.]|nr:FtsQ-type POTRA domain-containing protein [Treponema sp.]